MRCLIGRYFYRGLCLYYLTISGKELDFWIILPTSQQYFFTAKRKLEAHYFCINLKMKRGIGDVQELSWAIPSLSSVSSRFFAVLTVLSMRLVMYRNASRESATFSLIALTKNESNL